VGSGPTVYDVAAHASVSIATVSRALRRPADVSASTRERVLAAVQELGYVPSASARGLAARRTGVIGIFLPQRGVRDSAEMPSEVARGGAVVVDDLGASEEDGAADPYYDEVLHGAELEALQAGFAVMVGMARGDDTAQLLNDIAGRVDALGIFAGSVPDEVMEQVARRIPVTQISGLRPLGAVDHVCVDNLEGMRALTDELVVRHGVRNMVYLAGPSDSSDDEERYRGFMRALLAHGIDPSSVPVMPANFSRAHSGAVVEKLVADGELPRAVVCANDQMALGALDALARHGIRVPEDVIVTGFDGIEAGRLSAPRLTTVEQPMAGLGRAALRTMRERIASPDRPPVSVRLGVRVLLRESSEGSSL
jgi:LacI family transcriptional regulator